MTIPILPKWNHLSFSNSWWHPLALLSEIENIFHLFIHTHYKVVKSLWDHTDTFLQIKKYQNELLKKQGWLCNKHLSFKLSLSSDTADTPSAATCLVVTFQNMTFWNSMLYILWEGQPALPIYTTLTKSRNQSYFGRHPWGQVDKRTQKWSIYINNEIR